MGDGPRRPEHSTWITAIDDPYLPMYYAALNLWKFLGEGLDKQWISVSVAQTGDAGGLPAGRARHRRGDRRRPTARSLLIASGALSHTFWKLRQLRDHEAAGTDHILTQEAYAADLERIDWFKAGDHARVLDTMPEFMRYRPEAMFAHYLMMAGALGEEASPPPARQYGDYENSIGTGQVHLWFDRPEGGFPRPHATPEDPDYLRQMGSAGADVPAAG